MTARRKKDWYDENSFWRVMYPALFPDERFEETEEKAKKLLRLARSKGKDALDLCCGPGRFSIALAKRGYRVTGVDRTRFLLNKARARARSAKAKVEWVTSDMRDFVRPGAFDLVISMFTSFGYFEKEGDDQRVLRNISESLRPGGVCVFELRGKEWIAQHWDSSYVAVLPGGRRLVQRRWVTDDWARLQNEWIMIHRGRAKTYRFALRIYSALELRDRLLRAGFRDVEFYGDLDGSEYGLWAGWMVAVGRKGKEA